MDNSASHGASNTGDDVSSRSLTISDPKTSALMASASKVVILKIGSDEAKNKLVEVIKNNASIQSAPGNQAGIASRTKDSTALRSNNALSDHPIADGSNANMSSPVTRNTPTSSRSTFGATAQASVELSALSKQSTWPNATAVVVPSTLGQTSAGQIHVANNSYGQARGLGRMNSGSSGLKDEGAYSSQETRTFAYFPPRAPAGNANSAVGATCATRASEHTGSSTAFTSQGGRLSASISNPSFQGILLPASSADAALQRQRTDQSAKYSHTHYNRTWDGSSRSAGGYSPRRGVSASPSASGIGPSRLSPSSRHATFNTRIVRMSHTIVQPSGRPQYVPLHSNENTFSNAVAESSRHAEARMARQAGETVMDSIEIKDEDYAAETDTESDEDGAPEDLSRRSKEDAKTPILKAMGVVCEHVADCNTNSPFRKAISNYLGRNKKCIRDIPDNIWVHYCRKHYQRCKFRDDHGWTRKQCEMISEQIDRIQIWSDANEAAGHGAVVTHWIIILRKREAERRKKQSLKKEMTKRDYATKKSATDTKGEGKAPAEPEDSDGGGANEDFQNNDADDQPSESDASGAAKDARPAPDWMVPLQGQNFSFDQIRQVFRRLSNEVIAEPTRRLPDVEFLPVLNWIGGAKPAVVKYKKRAPLATCKKTPTRKPPTKASRARNPSAKGKDNSSAVKLEDDDDDYMDDGFEDVMADADEFHGRKRKRSAGEDEAEIDEYQSRARSAPVPGRTPNVAQAMRTLQDAGFEVNVPQAPTPSQRHMYIRPPRQPAPNTSGIGAPRSSQSHASASLRQARTPFPERPNTTTQPYCPVTPDIPTSREPYIPQHARPAYTPPAYTPPAPASRPSNSPPAPNSQPSRRLYGPRR